MSTPIRVTIYLSDEEIEQIKALLADHSGAAGWADWKDYARTLADLGFHQYLRERTIMLKTIQAVEVN